MQYWRRDRVTNHKGNDPSVAASQLEEDAPSTTESIRDALIKAVVSTAMPFGIGTALTNLLADTADQRWKTRVNELLSMFTERMSQLQERIENQEYYGSEEFQALIIEAIDQERTNRYKEKRSMMAQGLANSGTRVFAQDDAKETFFRILRDLTPTDINLLDELSKPLERSQHNSLGGTAARSIDPCVFRLQGLGLVSTTQRLPAPNMSGTRRIQEQGELNRFVANALAAEPLVFVRVTSFGNRFLSFLLTRGGEADTTATEHKQE